MSSVVLHCGDCLEYMRGMAAGSVDAVITDPPYFLPAQSYVGTRENGYTKRTIADMTITETWFSVISAEIDRVLRPDGSCYVFCDAQSYTPLFRAMYPYFKHVRCLIWDKVASYNGYTWRHQHELILWGERWETARIPTGDGDVLRYRGVLQKDRVHPAEKPVDLLTRLVEKCGGVIFDPYMGSGSCGVAAVNTGRDYIGCEFDPHHYAIAERRIAQAQQQMIMPLEVSNG